MPITDLQELLSGNVPPDYVLGSVYEIEDLLLMMKSIDQKIDFFKELKKHRTKSIDEKTSSLEEKIDSLRSIVLRTMKQLEPKQNTLNFPSIGSVTRRKPTGSWQVDDEQVLIKFLDENGAKDNVVKVKETIDGRKLKQVLDDFSSARVPVPGVTHKPGEESISIKYEAEHVPLKTEKTNIVEQTSSILDGLTLNDL